MNEEKVYLDESGLTRLLNKFKDMDPVKIVSFENGTDAEITAMLDAYYNDELSWEDMGWNIGDTRLIHLNQMQAPNPNSSNTWAEQDITVVIVAHDHNDLATPINGHTKACITVQTRECMNNETNLFSGSGSIYVNGDSSPDTNFVKWANLYMRSYLNNNTIVNNLANGVLAAIPSGYFKDSIKQSNHYRHTTYNGTESELVTDTLFLPSYPEIFGTVSYANYVATSPVEGTQFPYYATASNRIKYGNNNGASNGTAQYWWEGSASSNDPSREKYKWCVVNNEGNAAWEGGAYGHLLAPTWCM